MRVKDVWKLSIFLQKSCHNLILQNFSCLDFFCFVYFFTILRKFFPVRFTQPYSEERLRCIQNLSCFGCQISVYLCQQITFAWKKVWNCGVLSKFKSKSYFQKWPLPMVLFLKFVMEKKSNLQLCRYFLFSQFFLNPFAID